MEYCDAGTLEDVSAQGLPEVSIQQYTHQLLTGVLVLHDKGIVHRDIKGTVKNLYGGSNYIDALISYHTNSNNSSHLLLVF